VKQRNVRLSGIYADLVQHDICDIFLPGVLKTMEWGRIVDSVRKILYYCLLVLHMKQPFSSKIVCMNRLILIRRDRAALEKPW
jgi:hypothetical protein